MLRLPEMGRNAQGKLRLMLDARENVGQPSSQRKQRRSPEQYTNYMALVEECVEFEPSSFEQAV